MNAREWFDASLCFSFSLFLWWKGDGGSDPRKDFSTTVPHMHTRADRSTFAWVPMCFFVLLFSLYSLCFLFGMCLDHFAHVFSSPYLWICLFTFGFMLLFVLLSSAGKFCCTRAMLFYYFLPRTLRSLIFFRYSERVVSFTFFLGCHFCRFLFCVKVSCNFLFSH